MLSVEPTSSDRSDSCDNESETETRSESEVEPQPRASAALRARSEGDSETESDSYGGSSNSESVGTGGEGSDLLDVGDVPQPGAKRPAQCDGIAILKAQNRPLPMATGHALCATCVMHSHGLHFFE